MGDLLCAAGFNIRWLLRAIAKMGLAALLLVLTSMVIYARHLSWTPPEQATGPIQ